MAMVQPILSLAWEAAEILVISHKHSKTQGIHPGAHVGCELVLCGAGASIGALWISITSSYGVSFESLQSWASVTYFWGAVVILMA